MAGCSRKRGATPRTDTKTIAGVEVSLAGRDLARAKQIGGKGSVRRKTKAKKPTREQFDCIGTGIGAKKMVPSLSEIPEVEEVNLFRADGTFIHFRKPNGKELYLLNSLIFSKLVRASVSANMFVVQGKPSERRTLIL